MAVTLAVLVAEGLAEALAVSQTPVFMAEALHRNLMGGCGRQKPIRAGLLLNLVAPTLARTAQFASCGAVVDPILLTQRTYNT